MSGCRGISGLSDALLGQICSQFCPHCVGEDRMGSFELPSSFWGPEYFGTLAALTQVDMRIGRRAQLVRLHVFCGRRDSLPLLTRTILECPALAAHIFVVRLGDRDKDTDQGCILWNLATPQNSTTLETLVAPHLGPNFNLLCAQGEQRLLAQFQQLSSIEDSGFSSRRTTDVSLGTPGNSLPEGIPSKAAVAAVRIANARLNAFILFRLAKHIKTVVVLSEWPLALFPESKPALHIEAGKIMVIRVNIIDPGLLCNVEELRLDSSNENAHLTSPKPPVDISKIAGLLQHVPRLRNLNIRGGHNALSAKQILACRPVLANVTALNITATSDPTLSDILMCCNPKNLKHFRFTILDGRERPSLLCDHDIHARRVINLLIQQRFSKNLETVHIDTSESTLFAGDPSDICLTFKTVHSLACFTALRHLSISADAVYYPSLYPRVLLRDPNTGDEHAGQRLVRLLPHNIEFLAVTGVYAIHREDVSQLADACLSGRRFQKLKHVTVEGCRRGPTLPLDWIPYPVPEDDDLEFCADKWREIEAVAEHTGSKIDQDMKHKFEAAGIEYSFDTPQFYFHKYAGDWDKDPQA